MTGASLARLATGVSVRCEDLSHTYPGGDEPVIALHSIQLDVRAGESVAVLGPSGSGKSTLLVLLAGLLTPSSGALLIGGEDIARMSPRQTGALRSRLVAVVVQGSARNLLPYGTPVDNIRFAQRAVSRHQRHTLRDPRSLLDALGLAGLPDRSVGQLSGGEQQRLALAVAMSRAPGLLLVDEPTSQLDVPNRDRVIDLLNKISVDFGTTIIAVTHDRSVAQALGRTVTITDGRIVSDTHADRTLSVGADGSIALSAELLAEHPPGSRLRVVRKPGGFELLREPGDD